MEHNDVGKNLATFTSDIFLSKTALNQATSTYSIVLQK